MSGTWRLFGRLFVGSRRLVVRSLAVAAVQSMLLVPVALVVRHIFDTVIPRGSVGPLLGFGALLLGLFLASSLLGLWTRYATLRATKRAVNRLRAALIERLYGLPQSYFDRADLGTLHAKIVLDSERVDMMANALVAQLLPAALVGLVMAVTLAVVSWKLALLLLCVVPVLLVLSESLRRRVRAGTRSWQNVFDTFSRRTQLALRTMALTKAHVAEQEELEARRRELDELEVAGRSVAWLGAAYTLTNDTVAAAAGVVVLILGGHEVAAGHMSLGKLLAFYAVLALLRNQLSTILMTAPVVIVGWESLARLESILDTDAGEPYGGSRPATIEQGITFEDVTFGYDERAVLHSVSLHVDHGEWVVLVGPNGAGKSTIASLVLGLYRPWQGRLLADGVPFDELDLATLRRRIGIVPQDPVIFPGTIRENIAYGVPAATDDDVRRAAEWAGVDAFVGRLPEGYATEVGYEGVLLSGGQRQRVALARALLRQPSLVVLDEPTTHLDRDAVERLVERLRTLPSGTALLTISHDVVLAEGADRVYSIRDGRIVAPPRVAQPPSRVNA